MWRLMVLGSSTILNLEISEFLGCQSEYSGKVELRSASDGNVGGHVHNAAAAVVVVTHLKLTEYKLIN